MQNIGIKCHNQFWALSDDGENFGLLLLARIPSGQQPGQVVFRNWPISRSNHKKIKKQLEKNVPKTKTKSLIFLAVLAPKNNNHLSQVIKPPGSSRGRTMRTEAFSPSSAVRESGFRYFHRMSALLDSKKKHILTLIYSTWIEPTSTEHQAESKEIKERNSKLSKYQTNIKRTGSF